MSDKNTSRLDQATIAHDNLVPRAGEHRGRRLRHKRDELWSTAIEQSHIPMALVQPRTYEVIEANPAFHRLVGDRTIPMLMDAATAAQLDLAMQEPQRDTWRSDLTIDTPQGDMPVELHAAAVRDQDGQTAYVSIILRDTTVRRNSERKAELLQESLTHLARANAVGEMTTMLVHELNQPLAAILLYTDTCGHLLQSKTVRPEALNEALTEIRRLTENTSAILDQIRGMMRRKSEVMVRIDINGLIEEVLHICEHKLRLSNVVIEKHLADDLPSIQGVPVQIQQILLNFFINALDAMKDNPADRERRLTISTDMVDDQMLRITVDDTGAGVTDEAKNILFKPFATTKPDGLGVGLSISQTLAQAHGGCIAIHNRDDRGARATLNLPRRLEPRDA